MRKNKFLLFTVYCLLSTIFLWGCGDGPGAPGSSESEKTGIRIAHVEIGCAGDNIGGCPDIDVNRSDGIYRTNVDILIQSEQLNLNSTFDPFPASVEKCVITYKKAVEDPSSPTLESLTIFPNCSIGGCTATCPESCNVTLIDISRKIDYWRAILGGVNIPAEYPTHYVAKYNCTYVNNLDKKGTFQTEFDFWLADFVD